MNCVLRHTATKITTSATPFLTAATAKFEIYFNFYFEFSALNFLKLKFLDFKG